MDTCPDNFELVLIKTESIDAHTTHKDETSLFNNITVVNDIKIDEHTIKKEFHYDESEHLHNDTTVDNTVVHNDVVTGCDSDMTRACTVDLRSLVEIDGNVIVDEIKVEKEDVSVQTNSSHGVTSINNKISDENQVVYSDSGANCKISEYINSMEYQNVLFAKDHPNHYSQTYNLFDNTKSKQTAAELMREYRARKNKYLPSACGVSLIKNHQNYRRVTGIDDNVESLTKYSDVASSMTLRNTVGSAVDIHCSQTVPYVQNNNMNCTKTAAERILEYKARKMKQSENVVSSVNSYQKDNMIEVNIVDSNDNNLDSSKLPKLEDVTVQQNIIFIEVDVPSCNGTQTNTVLQNTIVNRAKTSTERSREYRARKMKKETSEMSYSSLVNKHSKYVIQNDQNNKSNGAKATDERMRAYEDWKNKIRQLPHTFLTIKHEGDNMAKVNTAENNDNTVNLPTQPEDLAVHQNTIFVEVDDPMHQNNTNVQKTIRRPKTAAERARDYRARRKKIKRPYNDVLLINKCRDDTITVEANDTIVNIAEIVRSDNTVEREHSIVESTCKKRPKTAAERLREYRARKKSLRTICKTNCKSNSTNDSTSKGEESGLVESARGGQGTDEANVEEVNQKHITLPSKTHTCDICNETFRFKCLLKAHLRTHSGEKPYSCDLCTKSYRRKHHLQFHSTVHSGEKPYTCRLCKQSFSLRRLLQAHKETHSAVKVY